MTGSAARVADATGNWVDTRAPSWSRPYLRLSRLDRPIGSWLLLMPCWWSAALAAGIAGDVRQLPVTLALFFIGAFVMRGAGCTWNDITDRDLDARVERTRSRPIPAGQVSVKQAAVFLVVQALIGLTVLLQFNRFAVMTGIASLLIVAVYPFMKRITWWPQIVLGLAFSWGALMGFAVTLGRIDAPALLLYAGLDRLGDRLRHHLCASGRRGRRADRHQVDRAAVRPAHATGADGVLRSGGGVDRRRPGAGRRALAGSGSVLPRSRRIWSGRSARLEISDPALCLRIFKSNRDAGLLLFAGLLVDAVMRASL